MKAVPYEEVIDGELVTIVADFTDVGGLDLDELEL